MSRLQSAVVDSLVTIHVHASSLKEAEFKRSKCNSTSFTGSLKSSAMSWRSGISAE